MEPGGPFWNFFIGFSQYFDWAGIKGISRNLSKRGKPELIGPKGIAYAPAPAVASRPEDAKKIKQKIRSGLKKRLVLVIEDVWLDVLTY